MNLKVAYQPFASDPKLREMNERVIRLHNSVHLFDRFDPKLIITGPDALKNVSSKQQLYIFAHGAPGGTSVYATDGTPLSVADLAQQLRTEKLKTSLRKIKLWACNGGTGGVTSTAKLLKDALTRVGFDNITVYGYIKCLAAGITGGHKYGADPEYDTEGKMTGVKNVTHAKKLRVKF